MFFVYAIQSLSSKRIYIGQTQNLDKRLYYHNSGYVKSTSNNSPWKLVAFMEVGSRKEARFIERKLKKSKGKREKWIRLNTIEK